MSTHITEVPSNLQQPSADPLPFTTTPPDNRIALLDVLRGVGVLGALFVSIWIFGGFSNNDQTGLLLQSKGWDYRLFGSVSLLVEGKMRALIAIVFGAGMVLFFLKAQRPGEASVHDLFIRRQMWLLLIGLINAIVFLWTGDMLFHLAIMGILCFPFSRLSARGLLIAATLTTLIYCGKQYWDYADHRKTYHKYLAVVALEKKFSKDSADRAKKGIAVAKDARKDTLTKKQQNEKGAWEGLLAGMKYDKKKDDGNDKAMRSTSYGKLWNHLLPQAQGKEAQWTYQKGVWDFASTIFLGMALLKLGFFTSFSRRRYLWLALGGITVGLLLGWYRLHFQQISLQDYTKYLNKHWISYNTLFPLERIFAAVGYASLIGLLLSAGWLRKIWGALAAVGRLALTNYLAQSLICTFFFTGFGAGYFARLQQVELYYIVLEICLVQTVFSVLWLRRYQYGPAEWLWRCLMYKKWLPNRIRPAEPAAPVTPALS